MRIAYLPLEPYQERYTELLLAWTVAGMERLRDAGVEHVVVAGDRLIGAERIRTGPVLDAHGRSHWSLTQVATLVRLLPTLGDDDAIWIEDLFTPGFEALPYILDQMPEARRPRIWTRNYAQSMDPDDFTFGMRRWMRRYEEMVHEVAAGVFVASTCHREMIEAACPGAPPVHVVGLPFDSRSVRERAGGIVPWTDRGPRLVYTSRLDDEKQPHLFLDVAERVRMEMPAAEIVVCTGAAAPRSNREDVLERLADLEGLGVLRVAAGLSKPDYYRLLAGARCQINTALQDFVSFTMLEASALEVPTLAPAFRSFIEELGGRRAQQYLPWSAEDATEKALALLRADAPPPNLGDPAAHHDRTIPRMLARITSGRKR